MSICPGKKQKQRNKERKKGQDSTIRAIRSRWDDGAASTSSTRMNPYGTSVSYAGRPARQVPVGPTCKA